MDKIGLFYGSDTGNTEKIAEIISEKVGKDNVDVFNLQNTTTDTMNNYSKLILGAPTWYDGELQSDWESHFDNLDDIDFSGKTVAFYGLGDQFGYSENFLDAIGIIHDKLVERGANIVGHWPTDGYEFEESKAARDGKFVGLALDEDNQSEMTDERIDKWLEQIKADLEF
ncbi:MAG: flavodoxin [Ignavibacteria bacterium]|jgi:flavodoxin I